jgi:dihydroorotase
VKAGTEANIPVMVDFGANRPERPITVLLREKLRPGDIYTHCYSGLRNELDNGHVNQGMIDGRKRGVIFDVGHGGGSFAWRIVVPMLKQGFLPDSLSTDLHIGSMNTGLKDMTNLMSKFLALGMSVDDVVKWSTWAPAKEIKHEELGNLSVGAPADVAVLSVDKGHFGYTDMYGARMDGNQKFVCQMTVRAGRIVYDLNGLSRPEWTKLPPDYKQIGDPKWDGLNPLRTRGAAPLH